MTHQHHILVRVAVAALVFAALSNGETQAQFQSLRSLDGAQAITHDELPQPQVFNEVRWFAFTTNSQGATVQLSCAPFSHAVKSSYEADGRLDLRVRSSLGAGWTVTVPSDETLVAKGDRDATVVAQSKGSGLVVFGLTMSFLETDVTSLLDGDYDTTVTGTITAN